MGFGVVGTKTLIKSSFVLLDIIPLFSLVAKPTAQIPCRGSSKRTTLLLLFRPVVIVQMIQTLHQLFREQRVVRLVPQQGW